jgi:hypothetical protein
VNFKGYLQGWAENSLPFSGIDSRPSILAIPVERVDAGTSAWQWAGWTSTNPGSVKSISEFIGDVNGNDKNRNGANESGANF